MIITASETKGIKCQVGDLSLLVDPEKNSSADVILRSFYKLPFEQVPQNVVIGPGEYEIAGIHIKGIELRTESGKDKIHTAYTAKMDDIRLCFLGTLESELGEDVMDHIGEVDILFLGAGGPHLEAKKAASLIKQLEPKAIVLTAGDMKQIAHEFGQKPEHEEKFVIKAKDLELLNSKLIWINQK